MSFPLIQNPAPLQQLAQTISAIRDRQMQMADARRQRVLTELQLAAQGILPESMYRGMNRSASTMPGLAPISRGGYVYDPTIPIQREQATRDLALEPARASTQSLLRGDPREFLAQNPSQVGQVLRESPNMLIATDPRTGLTRVIHPRTGDLLAEYGNDQLSRATVPRDLLPAAENFWGRHERATRPHREVAAAHRALTASLDLAAQGGVGAGPAMEVAVRQLAQIADPNSSVREEESRAYGGRLFALWDRVQDQVRLWLRGQRDATVIDGIRAASEAVNNAYAGLYDEEAGRTRTLWGQAFGGELPLAASPFVQTSAVAAPAAPSTTTMPGVRSPAFAPQPSVGGLPVWPGRP